MKKQTKKILFSIGAIATTITPISIALSCGSKTDQQKMNGITIDMVKSALNVTPSSTTLPSAATKPTTKTNVTLNGLEGVTITVSHVTPNDNDGTLTATADISKTGLNPPTGSPFTITWSGYQTQNMYDQILMNGITSDMVKSALNVTPSSTTLPSAATKPTTKTNVTLNGLEGVTITVSHVTPNDNDGTLTATADISKTGLNPPTGSPFTITWNGFGQLTPQEKMNRITINMVKAIINIDPKTMTISSALSELEKHTTRTTTINNLPDVTITLENIIPNYGINTIFVNIKISKTGLTPPSWNGELTYWAGFKH